MDIMEMIKKPFANVQRWALRQIAIGKLEAKIEMDEEVISVAQDRLAGNQAKLAALKSQPAISLFDSPPPDPGGPSGS